MTGWAVWRGVKGLCGDPFRNFLASIGAAGKIPTSHESRAAWRSTFENDTGAAGRTAEISNLLRSIVASCVTHAPAPPPAAIEAQADRDSIHST